MKNLICIIFLLISCNVYSKSPVRIQCISLKSPRALIMFIYDKESEIHITERNFEYTPLILGLKVEEENTFEEDSYIFKTNSGEELASFKFKKGSLEGEGEMIKIEELTKCTREFKGK